jgi:hypothetical protein
VGARPVSLPLPVWLNIFPLFYIVLYYFKQKSNSKMNARVAHHSQVEILDGCAMGGGHHDQGTLKGTVGTF